MADIQYVIDTFKELKPIMGRWLKKVNYENMGELDEKEFLEHMDTAIEALEKQIPKKPKVMNTTLVGEKFWWYCGHCGASRHTGSKSNYCGYCGGKVDWEVEK